MLCRFWIFLCIFMFLSSSFNVSYSLTNLWLLTRTCTLVNHTWSMGSSTSQFKQLFQFLSDPLNTNIVFIISKNIKLSHEKFRKFFTFGTLFENFWTIKETRRNDVIVSSLWCFCWQKWKYQKTPSNQLWIFSW